MIRIQAYNIMNDLELFNETKSKIDKLFTCFMDVKETHPHIIVIILHDFARNLYPTDPYIPFAADIHRLDYIHKTVPEYIDTISQFKKWGGYKIDFNNFNNKQEVKKKTGKVYGKLWNKYTGDMIDAAAKLIKERFENNNYKITNLENKLILDAGCGSGRYSCALAKLGAQRVVGLDYGVDGLEKARELAGQYNISNIEFKHGSVLEMPFSDETFDFVFHNGVFHHTENLLQATKELYRVLKTGSMSWFYIYGAGGVFWYARRKMNDFMKNNIPQDYSIRVLEDIGMPMNRFIFADNWYVPIEEHTSKKELETMLNEIGFSEFTRAFNGRKTDPDYLSEKGTEKDKLMWGDGELRYLIKK